MGYQIYEYGERFAGYGVPAICEHPDCNEKIDRGMSFACGGMPYEDNSCDRYFCEKHLSCGDSGKNLCEMCISEKDPFPKKPETKEWMEHLLEDESWAEWRRNNPNKAEEFKSKLNNPAKK